MLTPALLSTNLNLRAHNNQIILSNLCDFATTEEENLF